MLGGRLRISIDRLAGDSHRSSILFVLDLERVVRSQQVGLAHRLHKGLECRLVGALTALRRCASSTS
jgi:hypothetical protein